MFSAFRRLAPTAIRTATAVTAFPNASTSSSLFFRSMATIEYSPPIAKINDVAPTFSANAVIDGEIQPFSLEHHRGKWTVLLFYPKDFTFVCPTEIIAFSDRHQEFEQLNAQVVAISTDTEESHLAWIRSPRKKGGLGHMRIPIVADVTKSIAADYGVLIEEIGIALRGLFIINPHGVLEQITINNLPVGRSVDETLRLIQAFQFVAEHGEVCPANWKPGNKTMKADPEGSLEYFETGETESSENPFASASANIVNIGSAKEFRDTIKSGKVVVDFFAPYCGKCRQLFPLFEELSQTRTDVTFAKFDITDDALEQLSADLGITTIPAFHFFEDGQTAAEPIIGYKKKLLKKQIKSM